MAQIKLIIFDLDGTLIDAYPAIIRSFNYTMRKFHYPIQAPAVIRRRVGWGDKNLLKPFVRKKDFNAVLAVYRRHHQRALCQDTRVFTGALRVLGHLKAKGYRLAVASNRPNRFARILLRHLKLQGYFCSVLCADRIKKIKPHPEILRVIMRRCRVTPCQTLYVGDMAIDARAGRRAKVKTVIVTTGSSSKREIAQEAPFRIIAGLKELLGVL